MNPKIPAGLLAAKMERQPLLGRPFFGDRPGLVRHHSAPTPSLDSLRDHWVPPGWFQPSPPPSLAEQAADEVHAIHQRIEEAEQRVQAGLFRLLLRAAWSKVRRGFLCC